MKDNVPIPPRMQALPRDPRGYPIPWTVLIDSTDKAHFTINDEVRRQQALNDRLCPICGAQLFRGVWFVGGPLSALHPAGAYIDPPMHHECAVYALQVCPYLALSKYTGRIDDRTMAPSERAKTPLLIDRTELPDRPALFVAGMAIKFNITRNGYVVPRRPFHRFEFWQNGAQLAPDVGMALAQSEIERQGPMVEAIERHA